MLYNDIWYHIKCLKYTNNNPAQFFRYMLFYMKPDTVSIIISGIAATIMNPFILGDVFIKSYTDLSIYTCITSKRLKVISISYVFETYIITRHWWKYLLLIFRYYIPPYVQYLRTFCLSWVLWITFKSMKTAINQ